MLAASLCSARLSPVKACLGFLLIPSIHSFFDVWLMEHLLGKTKFNYIRVFITKEKRNKYYKATLKDSFCFPTLFLETSHHKTSKELFPIAPMLPRPLYSECFGTVWAFQNCKKSNGKTTAETWKNSILILE